MGKTYDKIPDNLISWIQKQEVFWVATAPLGGDGHVNVSPKGFRGTFHVENANKVWYEDLTGSGCETIAHIRENGRITFLFNALDGPPRIVRLFGRGQVVEFGSPEYSSLIPPSERKPSSRAVIICDIDRVGTSCGWGVPFFTFQGQRRLMYNYFHNIEKKEVVYEREKSSNEFFPNGLKEWWSHANTSSIDGLPSLSSSFLSTNSLESTIPDPKIAGMLPDFHKGDDAGDIELSAEEIKDMRVGSGKKVKNRRILEYFRWMWTILGGNDSKARMIWVFLAGVMVNNLFSKAGKSVRGFVGY